MRFKLGSAWFCDTECMDSVEDLVTELKALTPDQLLSVGRAGVDQHERQQRRAEDTRFFHHGKAGLVSQLGYGP